MYTIRYPHIPKLHTENLLRERKLVLLVDLDLTLIQTSFGVDQSMELKGIQPIVIPETGSMPFLRLRPGAKEFLRNLYSRYEMIVCTQATAPYARAVVQELDPFQIIFKGRIISREYFGQSNIKNSALSQIFFDGDQSLIHIIDDNASVWPDTPALIKVPEYRFFNDNGSVSPAAHALDTYCYLKELEMHLTQIHHDFYNTRLRDIL